MHIQQSVKIIFFLRKSKANASGLCPIYCRLTIDGLQEEISTGIRIAVVDWNGELKQVSETHASHKFHNKRLRQLETDLERAIRLHLQRSALDNPSNQSRTDCSLNCT